MDRRVCGNEQAPARPVERDSGSWAATLDLAVHPVWLSDCRESGVTGQALRPPHQSYVCTVGRSVRSSVMSNASRAGFQRLIQSRAWEQTCRLVANRTARRLPGVLPVGHRVSGVTPCRRWLGEADAVAGGEHDVGVVHEAVAGGVRDGLEVSARRTPCDRARCHAAVVRRLVAEQSVPLLKIGRLVRFDPSIDPALARRPKTRRVWYTSGSPVTGSGDSCRPCQGLES